MALPTVVDQPLSGHCYLYLAFLAGSEIDLDRAAQLSTDATERVGLKRNRRAPRYLDFEPLPLQITLQAPPLKIEPLSNQTDPAVEVTLFDFGAVSVQYKFPISTTLDQLRTLSAALYDNEVLYRDAALRVGELLKELAPAIRDHRITDDCEKYTVFEFAPLSETEPLTELLASGELQTKFAQILRAVDEPISEERVQDALRLTTAYGLRDAVFVDWSTAILIGTDTEDERSVLEFANVELLELRSLDEKLDHDLELAYDVQSESNWLSLRPALKRVSRLQIDTAMLYESVDNAIKLVGDQYLADVYQLISERYDLAIWHQSIRRKIEALDSVYNQLSDRAQNRRSEILEIIIVALIAFEIGLSLWERFAK